MVLRLKLVVMKDAPTNPRKEEYALGMGQRLIRLAVTKDVLI